jgi:hypothetical protein
LDSGQTKIANLEIAVFVDEDVAGLEITMDDTGGVDIFQTSLYREMRVSCRCVAETSHAGVRNANTCDHIP